MLDKKTVLILGAGASAEVGLPTGNQLKQLISQMMAVTKYKGNVRHGPSGSELFARTLESKYVNNPDAVINACVEIGAGIRFDASIDDFIDTHKRDNLIAECGKVAIGCAILEAERKSALFVDGTNPHARLDPEKVESTWYASFWKWLKAGVDKNDVDKILDNLTVISFNYDRCMQQFLCQALTTSYLLYPSGASAIVRKLRFFYPFGTVGEPFEPDGFSRYGVHGLIRPQWAVGYLSLIASIRTYSERIAIQGEIDKMRSAIAEAETLVFLGNAYHRNNMELLGVQGDTLNKPKTVFATNKGNSSADMEVVQGKLQALLQTHMGQALTFYFAETCSDLFQQYSKRMRDGL